MPLRILLVIFSILGIAAAFLPWLYFPKTDDTLYGYRVDGIVTGFLFFLILVTVLFTMKKYKLPTYLIAIIGLLGCLLSFMCYYKMIDMAFQQKNFSSDNILLATAMAGVKLGSGVYLTGITGVGILLTAVGIFIEQVLYKKTTLATLETGRYYKIVVGFLLIIGISLFAWIGVNNRPVEDSIVKSIIESEVLQMGNALSQADYDKFVAYNHVIMVNSMGGEAKMKELIDDTMNGLKEKGTIIKSIKIKNIADIQQDGESIQALLTQSVIFDTYGNESVDDQKMIAVSEDKGKSFQFINVTNKSKADIIKFFPDLNENLKF